MFVGFFWFCGFLFCFGVFLRKMLNFLFGRRTIILFWRGKSLNFFFVLGDENPHWFCFVGGISLILFVLEEANPFYLCCGGENPLVFLFPRALCS